MISDDTYDEVQYPKKNPTKSDSNLSLTSFPILSTLLFELLLSQAPCCSSLENQQACCSLLLVHSSPHYNVPSQGRDDSRIIFCFELLGPVSANSPVHMAPNMYAFFYSHPLPDPNRGVWRMLALQKKKKKKCNLLYTLPVSEQKDERSEDPKPWQRWCHQMLAVCF